MITILTDSGSGGTFLAWTLHYLAGHDQYYHQQSKSNIKLKSTPVQSNNAHGFIPNQPNRIPKCNTEQFQNFVNDLDHTASDTFHVLYFHPFDITDTTQVALEYANTKATKLIVVDTSDTVLYHCSYRKRSPQWTQQKILHKDKEIQDYFIDTYFANDKEIWNKLQLNNVWDLREFLALNIRPFEVNHVYPKVHKSRDHIVIKGKDLWTMLDFSLYHIFDYISVDIHKNRLDNWTQTYSAWRQKHQQRLMFAFYFDTIIHSILNNYALDITRFDLDIEQEAAIQHYLIYKHNLNFKTWQLEKFIDAKQLHSLLEPNTHLLT